MGMLITSPRSPCHISQRQSQTFQPSMIQQAAPPGGWQGIKYSLGKLISHEAVEKGCRAEDSLLPKACM